MNDVEILDGGIELRAVTGPDYSRIYDHELVPAKSEEYQCGDRRVKKRVTA